VGQEGLPRPGGAHGVRKLLPFWCGLASDLTRWVHGTLLVHGIVQVRDGEVQLVS
jgi:hypothetical protein